MIDKRSRVAFALCTLVVLCVCSIGERVEAQCTWAEDNCRSVSDTCTGGTCQQDTVEHYTKEQTITQGISSSFYGTGSQMAMTGDGNRAVVSTHTLGNTSPAALLIYEYNDLDNTWSLVQQISSFDVIGESGHILFGRSVALSRCDGVALAARSPLGLHVFRHDGTQYNLVQTITGNGQIGIASDFSEDGSRLVVGASRIDYVHVFEWDGSLYSVVKEIDKSTVGATDDINFGAAVACDANCVTVAISATYDTNPFVVSGAVYVFENIAESNVYARHTSEVSEGGKFGEALDMDPSGNVFIASVSDDGGHVEVFRNDVASFQQYNNVQKIGSGVTGRVRFGKSIFVGHDGANVIVSDPNSDLGKVHIYFRDEGASLLTLDSTLITPSGEEPPIGSPEFGDTFASDDIGANLLVSSPKDNNKVGNVRSFERPSPFSCV